MRHPSAAVILLALAIAAAAGPARAAGEKKHGTAERGVDLLIPPSFLKGKPIPPDAPSKAPLLFVFAAAGVGEARTAVRKIDAALAKKPPKTARVILVVRGSDQMDCRKTAAEFGAPHLEVLADPAGLMQAQFGITVGEKNSFHLRSCFPDGAVGQETDCEGFLKKAEGLEAAKPADGKAAAPQKTAEKTVEKAQAGNAAPVDGRSASPRLKEAYAALDAGLKARAAAKFRPVAGDKSGKEQAVVDEAQTQVALIERELDAAITEFKTHPTEQYVADLEEARAVLMPFWKEDGRCKNKVEAFIREWEKKEQVKNEYTARTLRQRIWKGMAAPKPDRKALAAAFQDIADKCPGTATGIQAAALAKALEK